MNIGFSTPHTGTPLQILPCMNLYFDPPEEGTRVAALEVGWLGWSLWLEFQQEDA